MVEGDGRSRPPGDSPRPGAGPQPPKPRPLPQDLPGLLASLGEYLEGHGPEELVVLLRTEIERRELRAYAHGWRDAAEEYDRALGHADRARRLSLVSRAPGRAAVIPFPQDGEDGEDAEEGRAGQEEPDGRDATERDTAAHPAETPAAGPPPPPPAEEPAAPDPAPVRDAPASRRTTRATLVPKSRSSKVPTIPRLRAARLSSREDREEGRGP
ncbi:hypothetical protein GCM10009730_31670 [Streptomyces albidochromogenes]|uniref:hypothetical protein n=1 Tax=Streptomyces albidochromogenes TaxID=329524 RepID=UPI002FE786C6